MTATDLEAEKKEDPERRKEKSLFIYCLFSSVFTWYLVIGMCFVPLYQTKFIQIINTQYN